MVLEGSLPLLNNKEKQWQWQLLLSNVKGGC